MEIKIPLPVSGSTNTFQELNRYLKQLELAVHYAQKSVKNAEDMGVQVSEDCIVDFDHISLEQEEKDNMYESLQSISLRIVLQ